MFCAVVSVASVVLRGVSLRCVWVCPAACVLRLLTAVPAGSLPPGAAPPVFGRLTAVYGLARLLCAYLVKWVAWGRPVCYNRGSLGALAAL